MPIETTTITDTSPSKVTIYPDSGRTIVTKGSSSSYTYKSGGTLEQQRASRERAKAEAQRKAKEEKARLEKIKEAQIKLRQEQLSRQTQSALRGKTTPTEMQKLIAKTKIKPTKQITSADLIERLRRKEAEKRMSIAPKKTYSVVEPMPSAKERISLYFKKEVKESGDVVQASLKTIGREAQVAFRKSQATSKSPDRFYQQKGITNLLGLAPQAAYLTPAAPALLVTGGTSKLTAYTIKPEILERQAKGLSEFSEQKIGYKPSSKVSKGAVITGAIVETGLGVIGLRSQYLGAKSTAIQKATTELEKKPIKSISFIDEGKGVVTGKGFRQVGRLKEEITYIGKVGVREGGTKFIPKGAGVKTITGKVTPKIGKIKLPPSKVKIEVPFVFGSKGTSIRTGQVGKFGVYEELGTSTVITKRGITKDITLPVDQRNIFIQFEKKFGVRVSPQEKGLVFTIPKKTTTGVKIIKGGTKPSTPEFIQQLYKPKPITTPSITEISAKVKVTPTTVPITIKAPSTTQITTTQVVSQKPITITGNMIQEVKVDTKQKVLEEQMIIPKEISRQVPKVETITRGKTFTKLVAPTKIITKTGVKEKQITKQIPILKSILKLKQVPITRTTAVPRPILPQVIEPKPPMPIPFKLDTGLISKAKKIVQDKKKFEVFVKKFGKNVSIGEYKSLAQAKSALKKRLRTTLRAGGHISKGGKKIKASKLGFTNGEFRRSKTNKFSIIERKNRRLKKGTAETSEIIGFRKGKSSKKKLLRL